MQSNSITTLKDAMPMKRIKVSKACCFVSRWAGNMLAVKQYVNTGRECMHDGSQHVNTGKSTLTLIKNVCAQVY